MTIATTLETSSCTPSPSPMQLAPSTMETTKSFTETPHDNSPTAQKSTKTNNSPLSSYFRTLFDSVALFDKEVSLKAKQQQLKRNIKVLTLMRKTNEEEQALLAVRSDSHTAQDTLAPSRLSKSNLDKVLQDTQQQINDDNKEVQKEEQKVHEQKKVLQVRKQQQKPPTSEEILEAFYGTIDLDEEILKEKMQFIVAEIFDSESTYLRDLKRYKEFFADELLKIIDSSTHAAIFQNLDPVLQCNDEFWNQVMELARTQPTVYDKSENIAKGFVMWEKRFIEAYAPYIAKYDVCIDTIYKVAKNKKFSRFVQQVREKLLEVGSSITTINSFSVTPVQRVPRYRLLLNDLYKKTPHSQYQLRSSLDSALTAVCNVADRLNEESRSGSLEKRASSLQNMLSLKNLDKREYLLECSGVRWSKDKRTWTGALHLFSDLILLLPERSSKKFKVLYFNKDVIDVLTSSPAAPLQIVRRSNNYEVEFVSKKTKQKLYDMARNCLQETCTSTPLPEVQVVRRNIFSQMFAGMRGKSA